MPKFAGAVQRQNWEKHGERPSILDYGAVGDCVFLSNTSVTNTSTTLTDSGASFVAADVGKTLWVEGLLPIGSDHLTTIASVTSATEVEMTDAAPFTVIAARSRYGTDNTAAIQSALDEGTSQGFRIEIPRGAYLITDSLVPYNEFTIVGQGYTQSPHKIEAQNAQIVSVVDKAIIRYVDPAPPTWLESFTIERVLLRGTTRTGSIGIHLDGVYGVTIRHCSFDTFGDQAILITDGVDGHLYHVFVQNAMLERAGRTAYVGCVDVLVHDMKLDYVLSTASLHTYPWNFGVTGFICGIAVRGWNCFVSDCIGHLSEAGIYLNGSFTCYMNSRADLNFGPGWVIDGSGNTFVGNRSHNNSFQNNGIYDGWVIAGGGNKFIGNTVTNNGPAFDKVNYAFHSTTPPSLGPNYFCENQIGFEVYTTGDYQLDSHPNQPISYQTHEEVQNRPSTVIRGDMHVKDGWLHMQTSDVNASTDEHHWVVKQNYGVGYKELMLLLLNDAKDTEQPVLLFARNGMSLTDVRLYRYGMTYYDPTGGTDLKQWSCRKETDGATYHLLRFLFVNDTGTNDEAWMEVDRWGGYQVNWVRFPNGYVEINEDLRVMTGVIRLNPGLGSGEIILGNGPGKIGFGSTAPEGSYTAEVGSLYLQVGSGLYYKKSGAGNTGWEQIASQIPSQGGHGSQFLQTDGSSMSWTKVPLDNVNSVSGTLAIGNGGTGASTAGGARGNLGVYSTTEVYTQSQTDSAIAAALTSYYTQAQIDTIISGLQTQIDGKAGTGHTHTAGDTTVGDHGVHSHTIT